MLEGRQRVLEVGCADAFCTRLVQQTVGHVTAVDFDPLFIADVRERLDPHWPFDAFVHDMLAGSVPGSYDAVYALDVLEHIAPDQEDAFLRNSIAPLETHGVAIFSMPSLESQAHASPQSKAGHVNCKTAPDFKRRDGASLPQRLRHVLDETMKPCTPRLSQKMAHYLIAVAAHRKS